MSLYNYQKSLHQMANT